MDDLISADGERVTDDIARKATGRLALQPIEVQRAHFRALLELGLSDSFRLFEQPEKSYSWWDYRMLGYQKNRGLRIDHILVSQPLLPRVRSSTIDRVPRKWEKPSDHAPVVLELGPAA